MELSSLSTNVVVVPYVRGKDEDSLSVNIDAFTPAFFREVGKRFDKKMKALKAEDKKKKSSDSQFFEQEARALEINREIYAELLSSGVLVDWTFTENGVPTKPTKDVLLSLPPRLVIEFWELCLNAAKTVKKRVSEEETTPETLESTHGGSMALRVVGQNG